MLSVNMTGCSSVRLVIYTCYACVSTRNKHAACLPAAAIFFAARYFRAMSRWQRFLLYGMPVVVPYHARTALPF
jgi:hypothetical protein